MQVPIFSHAEMTSRPCGVSHESGMTILILSDASYSLNEDIQIEVLEETSNISRQLRNNVYGAGIIPEAVIG